MTPASWSALAPLRFTNFRHLWVGTIFTQTGRWMDQVAQGWLMYQLTDSPLWVGLVAGARGLPMLVISLPGGVLVDRVDRRKLLLVGQASLTLFSLAQAALVFSGHIAPWHLLLAAFAGGCVMAVVAPTRQSIIPSVIQHAYLGNAVAVTTAGQNSTRVIGPSLAGLIIGAVGVGGSFALQTTIAASALWSTGRLHLESKRASVDRASPLHDMVEGLRYVSTSSALRIQMLFAIVPVFLAIPFQQLMPVFARDILGVGPEGLGLLLASNGGGAVVGAVLLASLNSKRYGPLLVGSTAALGILVLLFGLSSNLWFSFVLAALAGTAQALYLATNNTLIHLMAPDRLRGRILAIYMSTWSLLPLGTLAQGALASAVGAPLVVALGGATCTVLVGLIALRSPSLREL